MKTKKKIGAKKNAEIKTSFRGQAIENVVDEGVHDAHGTVGDSRVRVDLLQHLEDVQRPRSDSLSPALLCSLHTRCLGSLGRLALPTGLARLRGHRENFDRNSVSRKVTSERLGVHDTILLFNQTTHPVLFAVHQHHYFYVVIFPIQLWHFIFFVMLYIARDTLARTRTVHEGKPGAGTAETDLSRCTAVPLIVGRRTGDKNGNAVAGRRR